VVVVGGRITIALPVVVLTTVTVFPIVAGMVAAFPWAIVL